MQRETGHGRGSTLSASARIVPEEGEDVGRGIGAPQRKDPDPDPGLGTRGVVVLGMHRGGTSLVAGILAGAGFALGDEDVMAADDINPLGYFELESTMRLNDEILAAAGGSWDRPPPADAVTGVSDLSRARVLSRVETLVRGAAPAPLLVKDPRLAVLLPAWRSVIGALLAPVVVIRNPLESAYSLATRNAMSLSAGLALWEFTWCSLLTALEAIPAYIVRYEELLSDPDGPNGLIAWSRAVMPGLLAEQVAPFSATPPRPDLRRNRALEEDLPGYLTSHQLELWEMVKSLPRGEAPLPVLKEAVRPSPGCLVTLRRDAEARRSVMSMRETVDSIPALRAAHDELSHALDEESARVRYLSERVDALSLERDQRGERVGELEREIDRLRPLADDARSAAAERDGLRTSAAEALGRMRQAVQEAEQATAAAAQAREELGTVRLQLEQYREELGEKQETLDAVCQEMDAMRRSETWRIGSAVIRPVARMFGRRSA